MNADKFYGHLVSIVKPETDAALMWSSESDYPVEVVRLPDSEVAEWWPEISKSNEDGIHFFVRPSSILTNQIVPGEILRNLQLVKLVVSFDSKRPMGRVLRRVMENDKPAEITLFLLVRFCETWVGLKCKSIET